MSNRRNKPEADVVEQALGALRATPTPPDPPGEVLEKILAAGPAAGERFETETLKHRIITMHRSTRIVAAVLLVALAVAGYLLFALGQGEAGITWADVQKKVLNARTVTFTATMEQEGVPSMEIKAMVKGTRIRQEMSKPEEAIVILDMAAGKILTLDPKAKEGMLATLSALPKPARQQLEQQDLFRQLEKAFKEGGVEGDKAVIGGRQARAYRVTEAGVHEMTVWADTETGDPLAIELLQYGGRVKVTVRDLTLDPKLDDSLFSLKPPSDYEVMEMDIQAAGAEDVVAFLGFWADCRNGTFPDTLSEVEWLKDCTDAAEKLEAKLSKEQFQEFLAPLMRARLFLQVHPDRFGYVGKGVRKGDGNSPVLWFRPEGQEAYIVIHGDLSLKKDVAEKDLPKPPATKPAPVE